MAEQVHGKGNEYRNVSECGCVLSQQGDETWFTYCPMHKAAPEMLDALIACLDALDRQAAKEEGLFAWQRRDGHAVMRRALGLEAVAAARGQEVEA